MKAELVVRSVTSTVAVVVSVVGMLDVEYSVVLTAKVSTKYWVVKAFAYV